MSYRDNGARIKTEPQWASLRGWKEAGGKNHDVVDSVFRME